MIKLSKVAVSLGLSSASAATPLASGGGCANLGNSDLCINYDSNGYQALLDNFQGPSVYVAFNLKCDNGSWFGDLGDFTATTGHDYTYVFAVGSRAPAMWSFSTAIPAR